MAATCKGFQERLLLRPAVPGAGPEVLLGDLLQRVGLDECLPIHAARGLHDGVLEMAQPHTCAETHSCDTRRVLADVPGRPKISSECASLQRLQFASADPGTK